MNKKFLKGVAALFAVAVLGVSCSNNNPNTPKEKDNFPGLTIPTGANTGKGFDSPIKGKVVNSATASTVTVNFEANSSLSGFKPKTVSVTKVEKATSATATEAFTTVAPADFTVEFGDASADITLSDAKAQALYGAISGADNVTLKLTITITSDKYKDGTVVVYVNYKQTTRLDIKKPSANSDKNNTNIKIATSSHSFANQSVEIVFEGAQASKVQQKANARIIFVAGLGTEGTVNSVVDLSKLTDLSAHFDLDNGTAPTKLKLVSKESLNDILIGSDKPFGESPNDSKKGEIEVKIRFNDPADEMAPIDVTLYILLTGN